jgi:hypothetical protein
MPYRQMTDAELMTLSKEFVMLEVWRAYTAFAVDVYGSAAASIAVTVVPDYGDGGYVPAIDALRVYDRAGRELEADLSTEWWQLMLRRAAASGQDVDPEAGEFIADLIYERIAMLPPPPSNARFDVEQTPPLTYRRVYLRG